MTGRIRIAALGLSLMLGLSPVVLATPPLPPGKPIINSYTMAEHGGHLNQWVVRQGPDQRIYVGGGDGLVIFDGASWQAVQSRNRDRVRVMEIDSDGRIWIGSPNEFGYFDIAADGNLTYRSISDELPESRRNFSETRGLHLLGKRVYFQTLERLFLWENGQLTEFESWDGPFRVAEVHQDRYLVNVDDELYDLTAFPDAGVTPAPVADGIWPSGAQASFITSWPNGRLLLGTVSDGLHWWDGEDRERLKTSEQFDQSWPYRAIPGPDGSLLVGSVLAGLFQLTHDGELIEQVNRSSGLAVSDVMGLTLDHEQGLWLAQHGAIARVDLFNGLRIYDADTGLSAANDLIVHKNEWVIADVNGLGLLRAEDAVSSRFDLLDTPIREVYALAGDGDHLLVAGSDGVHRVQINPEEGTLDFHELLIEANFAFGLVPSRLQPAVYAELVDGLGVLLKSEQGWQIQSRVEGVNHRILTVVEDRQGRVWGGTTAGVYYVFRWQDQTLVVDRVLTAEAGVPPGYAWAFDVDGRLVLGTSLGGYRPVEGDSLRVELDPEFGNAALGEPRGVYRIWSSPSRELVGGIGPEGALWRGRLSEQGQFEWDGRWLEMLEPGVNWFLQQHDDQLWIGRHPGIIRVQWPPVEADAPPSHLQVFRVGYADQNEWLEVDRDADLALGVLPARPDSLRFEFGLPRYANPAQTEYRVRLDGLDADWSPWSSESQRYYSSLPGGMYRFQVQARDLSGQVFEADPLRFRVRHPVYFSPWAWVVYVVLALALLFLVARFGQRARERRLLEQKYVLAREVAEQTSTVRAQAREIRAISDARAQFFANVSHELRTPLTLIRGPLEELDRRAAESLNEEDRQYLKVALRNSESMQSLIGQVLDLQRLEAGRMPFKPERVDLAMLIEGLVDRFRVQAELRELVLTLEGGSKPFMWTCDPAHIDTMVSNLLSNAIKFTPAGGRVQVELRVDDGQARISVSDTGPGIDPADHAAVFQRYRQGQQTSATAPGTGIGLALVRELAELHGGAVALDSRPGDGARFSLLIPGHIEAEAQSGSPTPLSEPSASQGAPTADLTDELARSEDVACVLLVDDNPELRAFLRLRLGRSYRIEEAEDGEQGLARARELTPDVIIADGLMPKLDGLAMTRALKADPETDFIPVLMLTSRASSDDTVKGLEAGADDYLSKPFDSAELAARVAGLIASRRRLRVRLQAVPSKTELEPGSPFLVRARGLLDEHLADPGFSVADWARLMHMDRTTLFRRCKAELGQSPEAHLRERRLHIAAQLLANRSGNVAEVAEAVGFASVSHFSKRFKERFDATPAAFSRQPDPRVVGPP